MYNLFIKKKLFAKYPYLPKSVLYNVQALPEGMTSGSGSYERNSFVTVSAIAPDGFRFLNWTEDREVVSTKLNYTFIINSDRELVANFEENTYTVTTSVNPTGAGSATGAGTYTRDQNVTVKATPNIGYTFVNWTENNNSISPNQQHSFTITNNRNLTANFEKLRCTISASASPSGAGIITGTGSYEYGSTAQLKAIPNDGYTFSKWTEDGDNISTNDQLSFIVTRYRTLVANFEKEIVQYTITVNCDEGGMVTANSIDISNSSRSYDENTDIILKAIPNSGYKFVGWYQMGPGGSYGNSGTSDNIQINNIARDYTFRARFENQIEELSKDYLIFQALENNCEIKFNTDSASVSYDINLQYSIDEGNTWESMPYGGVTINKNEYILFNKGKDIYQTRALQTEKIGTFEVNKDFKVLGHPYCLITNDFNEDTVINKNTPPSVFRELFKNCETLQSVPENFLFAKYVVPGIYNSMFLGCTSLITAPKLPATLSVDDDYLDCYYGMFCGCTKLKNGPTISLNLSEILSHYRTFASMFSGCKALTSIKFNGPGTTFGNSFGFGEVDGIFQYWMDGVDTSGILTVTNNNYRDIFTDYKNIHGVPQNWTVSYAPEIVVTPGTPVT